MAGRCLVFRRPGHLSSMSHTPSDRHGGAYAIVVGVGIGGKAWFPAVGLAVVVVSALRCQRSMARNIPCASPPTPATRSLPEPWPPESFVGIRAARRARRAKAPGKGLRGG